MIEEVEAQPRVISYKRFSSMRQARGDSLRRQTAAAEAWCSQRGWKLDNLRLTDKGRSAFTGANRTEGALSELLKLIRGGDIEPGTYLLVEALDRISREELLDSIPLFANLVKAGLIIVTMSDGREWTRESMRKATDFMYSVMLFSEAHESSRNKGERVRARFEEGRSKESRKEFGSAPGWLKRENKEAPWTVIEERAESVRKVFEMAAAGYGSKAIGKKANAEKWPIPTRDTEMKPEIWHGRMAGRLLRMKEVTGAHEYMLKSHEDKKKGNRWQGTPSGIAVKDYYPRIVSDELWHRARASVEQRKTNMTRRDENYFNIWSGLMRCGECGAMIQRKTEPRGQSRAQLICSNKIAGVTDCKTGAAGKTDTPLLLDICAVGGAMMGLGYDKSKAQRDIAVASSMLRDNAKAGENLAEAIADLGPMPELLKKARQVKEERIALETTIAHERQKLALEPNSMLDTSYAEKVLSKLYERGEDAKAVRAECNERLRQAVVGIWHFAYDCALVKYRETGLVQHIALVAKTKKGAHPKLAHFAGLAAEGKPIELPGLEGLEGAED